MRGDDIVAYQYKAALYCARDIVKQLPTAPGEPFDGWQLAEGASRMSTEDDLNEIADAFGINRQDESSFDSGDFPKVVFRDQLGDDDRCDTCGVELEEE